METAGVAPIKAQYLTTKEKFHAYLDQEGERRNCQGDGKDARKDICTEPPAKLQKTEEGDGDEEEGRKGEDANKAEGGRKAGEDNKAEDGVMEEDGSKTEDGNEGHGSIKEDGSKKEDDSKADGSKTEDGNEVHGSIKEDGSKKEDSNKVHGSMEEDGSKVHGSMKEDGSKKEDSNKVHGSMEEDGSKVHGSMEEDGSKVHGSMKKDGSKADGSKTEDGNEVHGSMEEDGSKKEDSNKVHGSMEEDGSKAHGSMKEEGNKAEDGVMEVDDTKTEESQKTEGGNKADGSAKEDGSKAHGSMTEEGNKAEDGVMEVEGNKEEEGNKADGSPREEEGSKREEGNPPEEVSGNARLQQGRKRARGQNKIRPCLKPAEYEKHRLCPSIVQDRGGKCLFGSRCNYIHDVKEYVALKPPDLGEACILFSTFGKCPYGVTCRFAGAHTGKGHENVVNQELAKAWEGKTVVKNTLGKELQHQLRKKKFPFAKATEYLRRLAEVLEAKGAERQPEIAGSPDAKRGYAHNAPIWAMPRGSCVYPGEGPTPVAPQQPPPLIPHLKRVGAVTDEDRIKIRPCEKRKLDLSGKLYLAPLTTCGNLPFRRVCKKFGADITCGEMAVCTNLLQGQTSEWALLKRHHTEDIFGVQLEGSFPDTMTKCAELLNKRVEVDFVDINAGCPIDLVYNKGGGAALMNRMTKFEQIVRGMTYVLDVPLTVKIRTGVQEKTNLAHKLIPSLREWGVSLVTLHGRSREQRYTKAANWSYIEECAKLADPMPLFGNGDILSFEDVSQALQRGVSGVMIARGALIKPWIFTEVKERRHWDISSAERLEILKDFTSYGLEQWGSDTQGVEKTRRFLLEWLSFLCRYIPVGLLERLPQRINERPPYYMGRDYLETLMASQNAGDWIKISEILLGPVLPNFTFLPKHKANSYK